MKLEIKRFSILRTGVFFAILGLLSGIMLGIVSYLYIGVAINQTLNNAQYQAALSSQDGGVGINEAIIQLQNSRKYMLLLYPVISIAVTFVFGIVFAFFYNLISEWIGLRIEVEERKADKS